MSQRPLRRRDPQTTAQTVLSWPRPVIIDGDGADTIFCGIEADMSRGGVFIATAAPAEVGAIVAFLLRVDAFGLAEPVLGTVAWIREADAGLGRPGMGLSLQRPPARVVSVLSQVANRCDPILFECWNVKARRSDVGTLSLRHREQR